MKEGALIRFLLVALPAGLFVFGVGAMFVSHQRAKTAPTDPNEAVRLEAAALKRGPVDRADLARSLEMLAARIGERHAGKPETLESAALWFESTVGPANLGYLVERHHFEVEGRELRNLVAELPGRERRKEILVVGAHYDTLPGSPGANDNASGVAALVALARTFAGDPQGRTIRFVAFANGAKSLNDNTGSLVYANRCRARGETVVAMLSLDTIGRLPDDGTVFFTGSGDAYYFIDSASGAFAKAAGVPASAASDTSGPVAAGTTDQEAFAKAGFPAVTALVSPAPSPGLEDAADPDTLATITRGLEGILRFWANP